MRLTRHNWKLADVDRLIDIVTEPYTKEEMVDLHSRADVYVSASRGEGLELGAWDAKQCGNRIITTESGGANHFCDPDVDIIVPSNGTIPAHPGYLWGPDAEYIDYDLDALVEAFRESARTPKVGTRTWPGHEAHESHNVGRLLSEWALKRSLTLPSPA